ncbi:MAG: L-asparaginase, partial [Massilia sp.]|nr:L-asparaginase [Massilia sp.]
MEQFEGLAIVVHGGAGGSSSQDDGCRAAAESGMRAFAGGGDALDAVVAAVVVMENDPRFNAGTGAALGLDGKTAELDASVMDTRGRLGAVACLQSVRNPVLVARDVADSPHCLLCGEGALQFARLMGHSYHDCVTERARKENSEVLQQLREKGQVQKGVPNEDFARYWNYASPRPMAGSIGCDTVGAVARGPGNHFAVAGSTGGSAPSLL